MSEKSVLILAWDCIFPLWLYNYNYYDFEMIYRWNIVQCKLWNEFICIANPWLYFVFQRRIVFLVYPWRISERLSFFFFRNSTLNTFMLELIFTCLNFDTIIFSRPDLPRSDESRRYANVPCLSRISCGCSPDSCAPVKKIKRIRCVIYFCDLLVGSVSFISLLRCSFRKLQLTFNVWSRSLMFTGAFVGTVVWDAHAIAKAVACSASSIFRLITGTWPAGSITFVGAL